MNPPSVRKVGWRALGALIALLGSACSGSVARSRPNVLIVDVDTLRADHLGCYGYGRDTSPRIDRFAAGAHRFEWTFAQAPYTPPSQSSILTGLYVAHHGVRTRHDRLVDSMQTIAESYQAGGYETAGFVDGGFLSRAFGFAQGFDLYDDSAGGFERIGPKVIEWLGRERQAPFFLFVHSYDVHTPYAPPESYRNLFLAGLEAPTPGFEPTSERLEQARVSMWTSEPRPLAERDLRYAEALYDAEIRHVDDWFGRILDQLERTGADRDTIVVLISDHGEEFGEHGSILHEKPYATVTRIPLLIRLPGETRGFAHAGLVQAIDLAPTLVEMAELEPMPGRDGRSLACLLRGGPAPPQVAFGENPWVTPGQYLVDASRQILYRPGTRQLELYDYRSDPLESVDLAEQEPQQAAELGRRLAAEIHRLGRIRSAGGGAEVDPETERQLKALGYF